MELEVQVQESKKREQEKSKGKEKEKEEKEKKGKTGEGVRRCLDLGPGGQDGVTEIPSGRPAWGESGSEGGWFFVFVFVFPFLAAPQHMEFPGQASHPSHSSDLCHT